MKYGIYLDGLLMEMFDTPDEAYENAIYAYNASGEFHEVKMTHPLAKTINELWSEIKDKNKYNIK